MMNKTNCTVKNPFSLIGSIDWNGFINYSMKEIHIIEIKLKR